jgi:hypothetical protein
MLEKLKAEWKTAAWGAVCIAIEVYDSFLSSYFMSYPLMPEKYKWVDALVIPIGFLLLRRWRDRVDNQ